MSELRSNESLELVREYRAAARLAVDADRDLRIRLLALFDLVDAARKEEDRALREWIERAIWEEAAPLFGAEDDEPAIPADPVEAAARQLRAQGYAACPSCARPLHDHLDFERWRRIRKAAADRRDARKRAVG